MIGKLKGIIDSQGEDFVILDVHGVGYIVHCSGRTLQNLPPSGEAATLAIETHMREDSIKLFGFVSETDRHWFRLLLTVQGVGAKVALAILTVLDAAGLAAAIGGQDKAAIARAPGVGPKLAARIVSELKDKGAVPGTPGMAAPALAGHDATPAAARDALSALVNLGYGRPQASAAITASLAALGEDAPAAELIRRGLKELAEISGELRLAVMRGLGIGVEGPARPCRESHVVDEAEHEPLDPRPGDHGAIIGAKTCRRQDEPQPGLAAKPHQHPANGAIGGNPARHHHGVGMANRFPEQTQAGAAAVDDRIDHRGLKRRADIRHIGRVQRSQALHFQPDSGFETGKGKIRFRPAKHGARQIEPRRIAVPRQSLDLRSAGIGKAQHFPDLIEGFPGRVVDGRTEAEVVPNPLHRDQLGMAAGDQEQQIGKGEFVGEARRQGMRLEMVDRQERLTARQGQGFRRGQPHNDTADEARPRRRGDPVEVRQFDPGTGEGKLHEPVDDFDMGARRDLRHHPAVSGVLGDLAHDLVR